MASSYIGAWRQASDSHYLWQGADWASFTAKWKELSADGLRLSSITTFGEGAKRRWAGVYRAGGGGHYLWAGVDWAAFTAKWKELAGSGLRLADVKPYIEGGDVKWAGVWRAGTDGHYLWAAEWPSFEAKWKELSGQGLRLTRIDTYEAGGARMWVGVWRAGSDGHYLWAGKNWKDFTAKWKELGGQGLRLVDVATYVENGERRFAGAWRSSSDGYELFWGSDVEQFLGHWNQSSKANQRLVALETIAAPCSGDCCNHVCSIDKDGNPAGYDYYVTGDPAGPYRWPVDDSRYARVSALTFAGQPFTIPFKDKEVKRHGTWIYQGPPPGNYHHAIDYSRSDGKTFSVVAAAAGTVAFVGWDNWSGNTVVVSHDVGGVKDSFRTVYMHLRGGPKHDIDDSWNNTLPTLSGTAKTNYQSYLTKTGAAKDPAKRKPDAAFWGTQGEAIASSLNGKKVSAGEHLAWSGCTGPGGCGCTEGPRSSPNTHLHIFFCHKDSDGNWYFIDPYGIYSYPDSGYPDGVTGAPSGPCVRYSVSWKGGKPQYP